MPDLGVSQRTVVAKRPQRPRTDAQLLAEFLIVHPAAEPTSSSLSPRISFTRSEKRLNFPTISSNTSFEIITNSFIAYTVFIVGNPVCLQVKPMPASAMALLLTGSLWLQVVGIGLILYSATAFPVADCTKKSQLGHSNQPAASWQYLAPMW